jgi:hypothetical protein
METECVGLSANAHDLETKEPRMLKSGIRN